MPPQSTPSRRRCVQQIVRSDASWSVREVSFNLWEDWAQDGDPFCGSLPCFLVVLHWAVVVECPETNLWMNLKRPPLAVRRYRIVYLLNLRCDAPCLLAQPSRRLLPI